MKELLKHYWPELPSKLLVKAGGVSLRVCGAAVNHLALTGPSVIQPRLTRLDNGIWELELTAHAGLLSGLVRRLTPGGKDEQEIVLHVPSLCPLELINGSALEITGLRAGITQQGVVSMVEIEDCAGLLALENDGDSLRVNELTPTGSITVSRGENGRILALTGLEGDITLDSKNSLVLLSQCRGKNCYISKKNSALRFFGCCHENLEVESKNGDIYCEYESGKAVAHDWKAENGDITLLIPADCGYRITASIKPGGLQLGLDGQLSSTNGPDAVLEKADPHLHIKVGNQRGRVILHKKVNAKF